MKVLVNLIILFNFFSLILFSQIKEQKIDTSKVKRFNFFEKPKYDNFTDGIMVLSDFNKEYFVLKIKNPKCCQKGETEISLLYEHYFKDSLVNDDELTIVVEESNSFPVYKVNTLNCFKNNNEYVVYFFCSMENILGGLDPQRLILWVYYRNEFYKFSGTIPLHPDWSWATNYSFSPDNKLKSISCNIYNKIINIWNNNIKKYKKYYLQYNR